MTSRIALLCVIFILMMPLAACQDNPAMPVPTGPAVDADKALIITPGSCNPALHIALEEYWHNDQGIVWEVFQGIIDRHTGGELTGHPAGWPPGHDVRLRVPAGAIPADYPGGDEILFTIEVPAQGPPSRRSSVPYHFHPDGIQFATPIEVTLCWPAWAGPAAQSAYNLLNLRVDAREAMTHYAVRDLHPAWPTVAATGKGDKAAATGWTSGISFAVNHFSRWEVANGDEEGGGGGKNLPGAGLVEGASCWSGAMVPIDPVLTAD